MLISLFCGQGKPASLGLLFVCIYGQGISFSSISSVLYGAKRTPRNPLHVCLQASSPQLICCQPSHVSFICNIQGFLLFLARGGGSGTASSSPRTGTIHLILSEWKEPALTISKPWLGLTVKADE